MNKQTRTRLAIASALAATIAVGGAFSTANAAVGASAASTLVPITPCRLVDTRAIGPVGARSTALAASETADFAVWGINGNCTIPSTATGIVSNITAVNGTSASFLTVYPADGPLPLSSNLNWTAASAPIPNQVTVGLSSAGGIKAYNKAGSVDIVVDIVGYYEPASGLGATGPSGPAGPAGPVGPAGPAGVVPDRIPSGKTVVGFEAFDFDSIANNTTHNFIVHLPAKAGVELTDTAVNFANTFTALTPENDATCTGTLAAPTAPPGKVCLYLGTNSGQNHVAGYGITQLKDTAFDVAIASNAGNNYVTMTWAYTAP